MGKNAYDLVFLARQAMKEKGLVPDFGPGVSGQLKGITEPARPPLDAKDLTQLLWCSIDNDDSRDLDQLTFAEKSADGKVTLYVAIADVDALVFKDTPIDSHAQINTTSVYTPAVIFPMLPLRLSTDLTSLNEGENRVAMVVKVQIGSNGEIASGEVFQAVVRNYAKLAYPSLSLYFEGQGAIPEKIKGVSGLEEALQVQYELSKLIGKHRHELGALTLESPQIEAKVGSNQEILLKLPVSGAANQLIENFMIAANNILARELRRLKIPSLRRVVRVPKNWSRIVEIATLLGETLPEKPDPKALDAFLVKRKGIDSVTFPDLSLSVIKLLGRGEYIVETPGDAPTGHFGLALSEYIHSTAPNRRFPDLISQRQYKAFLRGDKSPYTMAELTFLAEHCTDQEDASTKVERQMSKVAAAVLLESHLGEVFEGIITGVNEKGTWVRVFSPPTEGKIIHGDKGLQVGDKVEAKLISVDVPRGYINFSL